MVLTSLAMVVTMLYAVSKLPASGAAVAQPSVATVTVVQGAAPEVPAPAPTAAGSPTIPEDVRAQLRALARRDAEDPRAKGRVDAPVVLVEWADYRCPFCGAWSRDTLPQLQRYVDDGTLRIEYRDLPLFGDQSMMAAVGGHAAAKQGKFWEYYTVVTKAAPTSGHPDWPQKSIVAFAREAGVPDLAQFTKDLADPALKAAVERDANEIRAFGVSGTPFFLVNDVPIQGAQPVEAFVAAIDEAARRATGSATTSPTSPTATP